MCRVPFINSDQSRFQDGDRGHMVRENAKRTSSRINIYLLNSDIVIKCLEQEEGRTKREEKRGTKRDCDVGILFGAHSKRYHGL